MLKTAIWNLKVSLLLRNDFSTQRTSYGTVVFIKDHFHCKFQPQNENDIEMTFLTVLGQVEVHIVAMYCRPKEYSRNIQRAITTCTSVLPDESNNIIIGDFNTDERKYKHLTSFLQSKLYNQLVTEETTNNHTTIDLIFTNIPDDKRKHGVLESYFSYHKPIWISVSN